MKQILLTGVFVTLLFQSVFAATVQDVSTPHDKRVDITLSSDVVLTQETVSDSEIQILKDIEIAYASRDLHDLHKATILLHDDIVANTRYSLIGIFGADGTLDFITPEQIIGHEISPNNTLNDGILRAEIIDAKTLDVYFHNPLTEENIEFKLLNELQVASFEVQNPTQLSVILNDTLQAGKEYIAMILSLTDDNGLVFLEEELNEFQTDVSLQTNPEDNFVEQIQEQAQNEQEDEVAEVALNAAETPDTGAATWVLIGLTLLIQAGILARRFMK
ncbi:hypothetical protein MK079_02545 [Candidatus Gracilibacteria bacterium]|nr:hypothetical protein [Candidatus Gracilibacteria bacterium]